MRPLVLYLHGFLSSSNSEKAKQLHASAAPSLNIDVLTPSFSSYPMQAYQEVKAVIDAELAAGREKIALIGSSLGGFMATVFAQQYNIPAVLINPVVDAPKLAALLLGEHKLYHSDDSITLTEQHIDELKEIELSELQCQSQLKVLLQTGDEVLDYRQAEQFYAGADMTIEEGGDHGFKHFENHLDDIFTFLKLQ